MIRPIALLGCTLTLAACLTNQADRTAERVYEPYPRDPQGRRETVSVTEAKTSEGRRFHLTTTQPQRDDTPKKRVIDESGESLRVETGDVFFDALFAMAVDDLDLVSVDRIRDDHYNDGQSIDCKCFQTGEKWRYVWTRDLAYAADLSLAALDPQRTVNSLLFKTSDFREEAEPPAGLPEESLQIVQDTGSGGSWAVSTDRVSWALAARRVLDQLEGEARADFADKAYRALRGTIEADRQVAYDAQAGLYGGEQSYLDWRVQTYAPWILDNLSRMAEIKALSTNVVHYQALDLAAELARQKGNKDIADRYGEWAENLKRRINQVFWLEEEGLYASLTASKENPVPVRKYDMLGTSLAILYGVASPEQAETAIGQYPLAPFGPPVYFPQQPNMYVYHNRALWPFVTAYALKASAKVENYRAVNNAVASLMRGSALNLSNMENLEWLTGKPYYDDGPAINSRRQLWSVAGYLSMVTDVIFGYQAKGDGFRVQPFLTAETRKRLGDKKIARLSNLPYRERSVQIELQLPPMPEDDQTGFYEVTQVTLNGEPVKGKVTQSQLQEGENQIRVTFGRLRTNEQHITQVPQVDPLSHTDPAVFAPEAPVMDEVRPSSEGVLVRFNDSANESVQAERYYNLYRNGTLIGSQLETKEWLDQDALSLDQRQCYAVEAVFAETGHHSQFSKPLCYGGELSQRIGVDDSRTESHPAPTDADRFDRPVILDWGKPGDSLSFHPVKVDKAGRYAVRLVYNNRQHTIDSGVTNATKRIELLNEAGSKISQGVVQMPNLKDPEEATAPYPLKRSTEWVTTLEPGQYQVSLSDYFNMSYLASNSGYAASGGASGPVNQASIAALQLVYLGPVSQD